MKVIVNSPDHKNYHGKEMYVLWTSYNRNGVNKICEWYHLGLNRNNEVAELYLSKDQVIIPDDCIKILCVLQNAYSDNQRLRAFPFFKVNPRNKSGKRMIKICGEDNDMFFSNVCPDIYTNPKDKGKTDLEHLKSVLKSQNYDLYVVCGSQAEEAVEKVINQIKKPIIFMPHPASRSLTNKLCQGVENFIEAKMYKSFRYIKFRQLRGNYEYEIQDIKGNKTAYKALP